MLLWNVIYNSTKQIKQHIFSSFLLFSLYQTWNKLFFFFFEKSWNKFVTLSYFNQSRCWKNKTIPLLFFRWCLFKFCRKWVRNLLFLFLLLELWKLNELRLGKKIITSLTKLLGGQKCLLFFPKQSLFPKTKKEVLGQALWRK